MAYNGVMETLADEIILYLVDTVPESYGVISRLNWRYRGILWDVARYKRLCAIHVVETGRRYWKLPNGGWHGPAELMFSDGQVSCRDMYVDGEKHGKYLLVKSTN